jgi:thioredoxin 1
VSLIDELDQAGLDRVLREETRVVLVDCWSPWCAPCRVLRPHLERLAEEHRDSARIVAVNVEAQPRAAAALEVQALPTLVLFKDGSPVHRFTGTPLPREIASALAGTVTDGSACES